MLVENRRL